MRYYDVLQHSLLSPDNNHSFLSSFFFVMSYFSCLLIAGYIDLQFEVQNFEHTSFIVNFLLVQFRFYWLARPPRHQIIVIPIVGHLSQDEGCTN